MKKIPATKPARRSPFRILCARLTLAAFAATLPGPALWAQVVGRVAPVAPVVGSAAAGSAASSFGGSIAPALGVGLAAPSISEGVLAAPSLTEKIAGVPNAAPVALPAAVPNGAAPKAVTGNVPLSYAPARPGHPIALPVRAAASAVEETVAPVSVGKNAPTAIESLNAAAGDGAEYSASKDSGGPSGSGKAFDGTRERSGDANGAGDGNNGNGGSKSRALVPIAEVQPPAAPVIALEKIFFPGSVVRVALGSADLVTLAARAIRAGGWMIVASAGNGTEGGHNATAVLAKVEWSDGGIGDSAIRLTIVRPVKINGYEETKEGVDLAKVSYPPIVASDASRLGDLGALAQQTLEVLAPLDSKLDAAVVAKALKESNSVRLANYLAQELPFPIETKLRLLGQTSDEARMREVLLEMSAHFKTKSDAARVDAAAKDGKPGAMPIDTLEGLKAKMQAIGMPAEIQEVTLKEFEKLSKMNPKDSEASKLRTYIEWLTDVPYGQRTEDNFDIARAHDILNHDHSGLERVKERVLEFLALRKKTGSKKGAIIAFTGPPGVGKTSIAAAIAEALGRKFVRLSLGGVSDETVLRGHGRTYLGSMPGEIMRQMKAAGTVNPVMLMDEVDKIGRNGNHGDPTAALLEILDPAQNNTYRDRYLDIPYDLSEVLFVVTANELSNIPEPLRDRMEIIEFDGYTTLEKIDIAESHIIPQKLKVTGLKPEDAQLTRNAIRKIIEGYTMEAGVRTLRERIEAVLRKISAWTETKGEKAPGKVDEDQIEKYLGVPKYSPRAVAQNGVGVATGLAVNAYGGSTLNVEVSVERGSGQLKLRNQFGEDIADSAKNALKFVKTHAADFGLADFDFGGHDIDINITPAGKVDGPSAGTLMVTAIISALTGRPVTPGLAMTGEITMRGDVLPIGGLKQKVMAAHRMGYTEVIFPAANLKDVEDIPKEVRDGIKLKPAKTYADIYPDAIAPESPEQAKSKKRRRIGFVQDDD